MNLPIQVTFRDTPHSDAVEAYVRRRAEKLETYSNRITACRVVLSTPHRHHHAGRHFSVRIDLSLPHAEVVVNHTPDADPTHEDAYAAIDDAFARLSRRLEEHVRKSRDGRRGATSS